jgi:hypothetical protein
MPQMSFIPTLGDSAELNNPLSQVSALQRILLTNQQAKQQEQIVAAQLANEHLKGEQIQLENIRLGLLNNNLPQQLEGQQRLQTAQTENYLQSALQSQAQTYGVQQQNDLRDWTVDDLISQEKMDTRRKEAETKEAELQQSELQSASDDAKSLVPELLRNMKNPDGSRVFSDDKMINHMSGFAIPKAIMELQMKQEETQYYKERTKQIIEMTKWKSTMNTVQGSRIQEQRLRTYATLKPAQAAEMLQSESLNPIERDFLRARAIEPEATTPEGLFTSVIRNSNDPDTREVAARFILEMRGVEGTKVPLSIDDKGKMTPAHTERGWVDEGIRKIVNSVLGSKKSATTKPTTQSLRSDQAGGSRENPVKGVAPGDELNLPLGTWYQGTDGRLRQRKG